MCYKLVEWQYSAFLAVSGRKLSVEVRIFENFDAFVSEECLFAQEYRRLSIAGALSRIVAKAYKNL